MTYGDFILLVGSTLVFASAAVVLPLIKKDEPKDPPPPAVVLVETTPGSVSTIEPEKTQDERVEAIKQDVEEAREDVKELRHLLQQRSKGEGDGKVRR